MVAKRNIVKFKDTDASATFTIIGISSHENDYRISWCINEELGFAFAKTDNLETGDGNEFTCFVHEDDEQKIVIISNRCDNGFLFEKHKSLDFIMKFDKELNEMEITEWLRKLRKVTLISTAFTIPVNKQMLQLLEKFEV